MKNVTMEVQKGKLIITVDTTKTFGLSGSGKSEIIASTEGNATVDGLDGVKVGLNVYKPVER